MSDHQIIVMTFVFAVLATYWLFVRDAQDFRMGRLSWFVATIPVFLILAVAYGVTRLAVSP